ncbi:hypothetical protein D3C84_506660 [compost metagenome]
MVGIGMFQTLADRLTHAVHFGVARPVELRKRPAVAKQIAAGVVGHFQPVDAPYILTPADELTDKAFGGVQGNPVRPVRRLDVAAHLTQIQQADIQRGADSRMKQERLVTGHCILIVAEGRQTPIEEVVPQGLGIGVGHRVVKGVERAVVAGEVFCHQRQHILGDGIGRKAHGRGRSHAFGQGFAVFGIKVPGAADGAAITIEQQAAFTAHLTVEELHAQLLFAFGPGRKFGPGAKKTAIAMPLYR